MNKSLTLFFFLFISYSTASQAQYNEEAKKSISSYLGLGTGLDYGGIGIKFEYQPIKYLGISGSLGFNFQGPGINLGASFYPLPDIRFQPMVILLYGYNAAIVVANLAELNKTYYGVSPGIGSLLKTGKKGNKLYLAVFHPFRSQTFQDDYEALKVNPQVKLGNELPPITISIGFNWAI